MNKQAKRKQIHQMIGTRPLLVVRDVAVPADLKAKSWMEPAGGAVSPAEKKEQRADGVLEALKKIENSTDIQVRQFSIDRSFLGRNIVVTTTPIKIITSSYAKGYTLLNPAQTAGFTATGIILASAAYLSGASGNTQGAPLNAANYKLLGLFLNVTAISGATVAIDTLTKDQISGNWATAQTAVFSVTATGTYYVNLGTYGVDSAFAIAYTVTGGTATFGISYVLKDGLPGSSTGLSQTVYIGPSDSINATTGFPLLEGQKLPIFTADNTEIWAVSDIAAGINLKIFELQ